MLRADCFVNLALDATEGEKNAPSGTAVEGQDVTHTYTAAHVVPGINPTKADADVPTAHIDRRALTGLIGQLAHEWQQKIPQPKAVLIHGTEN